jgi:hypothetical protein
MGFDLEFGSKIQGGNVTMVFVFFLVMILKQWTKKTEILGCGDDVSCVDGVFSVSLCMFVSAKLRMVSATALSFCTPKPKSEFPQESEEFRNENGWQAVRDSKERSSFREEIVLWCPGRRFLAKSLQLCS